MKAKTVVTLARLVCGTTILVASMVTGVDGTYQMISMLLLGLPVEGLQRDKEE